MTIIYEIQDFIQNFQFEVEGGMAVSHTMSPVKFACLSVTEVYKYKKQQNKLKK